MLVAVHVAGKAVRDTLFLSSFEVTDLPKMMIAGSAASLLAAIAVSRFLSRFSPARTVPLTVSLSAGLLFGEWLLVRASPGLGSIAVYLHLTSLSLVLFSGFWSLVNERFDPYTAKTIVPRISGFGALGGVLGGTVAAEIAPRVGIEQMLTGFAVSHLLAAFVIFRLGRPMLGTPAPSAEKDDRDEDSRGWRSNSLILRMAFLVAAIEGTEKLIDYAFKAAAADAYASETDLVRFFAIFYTVANVTAFVLQTSAGPRVLRKLGVGGTLALVPSLVAATSAGAAAFHQLATATLARGATSVLGTSLFKASFELLWTPVPAQDKRRAKIYVDVGASGLGELIGSGLVLVLVAWISEAPTSVMLALAAAFSLGSLLLVLRLHGGYVSQLATNLREGGRVGDELGTMLPREPDTLVDSRVTIDRAELMARLHELDLAKAAAHEGTDGASASETERWDPLAPLVSELESADPKRIRAALSEGEARVELVPLVIPMLGRPTVAEEALSFLRGFGDRITGQLVDALLDAEQEALVRRRIPGVLEATPGERVLLGLSLGFGDPDFDVELECVRSALRVVEATEEKPDREDVFEVVERTLAVDPWRWDQRGRRRGQTRDDSVLLEANELAHIDRNLELIFTALAALFGHELMASTLRAIYFGDPNARGTALEYLQSTLPERIRKPLFARIPGGDTAKVVRGRSTELAETLRGSSSTTHRFHANADDPDESFQD